MAWSSPEHAQGGDLPLCRDKVPVEYFFRFWRINATIMRFSRIKALVLVLSLLGRSGALTVLHPRALPATHPAGTLQTQSFNNVTTTTPTTPRKTTARNSTPSSLSRAAANSDYPGDHPDWAYLNGETWWRTDATQQDHARFHAYLSMSAYGNYASLCPSTFTQGFTVLESFNAGGQQGFTALIPEMDKVVIVFRGYDDLTPVSIEDLVSDCQGCMVASAAKQLYLAAKRATNNWARAIKTVADTKRRFSVTGHGYGGAVAAVAALDLGSKGLIHYSHNQGMPRALNHKAVIRYDNLFQVLAGQSLVSEDDFMVQLVPTGPFYHVGSKVKILGPNQQYLINCYGYNENRTCTGRGNNVAIHDLYFTPKGQCGSANKGW
ncbi:hypothetical protein VP01_3165g3 [Puccinia sorghi]|uniref:Fungal lipase-type domain-containing protein n=1 Tax=Puccinia sorghi TaxID=27349 RepID=A0A0L6UYP6_9BASI|nr:hypothetical protein VP01_3165g3 [Puccinia sorghi]